MIALILAYLVSTYNKIDLKFVHIFSLKIMYSMFLLLMLFTFVSSFDLTTIRQNIAYDYNTPKWVYKNVYEYNKKYNKITKKLKKNKLTINDEYDLIKFYKLPYGFMQPPSQY